MPKTPHADCHTKAEHISAERPTPALTESALYPQHEHGTPTDSKRLSPTNPPWSPKQPAKPILAGAVREACHFCLCCTGLGSRVYSLEFRV